MTARDSVQLLKCLGEHCARALEEAVSLAQTRAHPEITVEHWLLKFLELGDGDIPAVLRRYEIDSDPVWQALLAALDRLPRQLRGKPKLSRPVLDILESAWWSASMERQSRVIRSADILTALIASPHYLRAADAWPLLSVSKIQLQRLMPELDRVSIEAPVIEPEQKDEPPSDSAAKPGLEKDPKSVLRSDALAKFTNDITAKARDGQIDPVFGREREISQIIGILSRRRKNNPILVGEPGVGKTALVEGLALKIAEGDVPGALKKVRLLTVDLGLMQAGAGVKGEFEQRLRDVIEAVKSSPDPVMLFIDEAHTMIGAGNSAGGADAANLLKPALARGELRTIAATTWSEYKQFFERDAALERRFQMVKIDEPDDEAACQMLRGLSPRYAEHHGVHIRDEAVTAAVHLSRRYLTGRLLPDKAVDLIDTASALVRMSQEALPPDLIVLKAKLSALEVEEAALKNDLGAGLESGPERLAALEADLEALHKDLAALEEKYENEKNMVAELRRAMREPGDGEQARPGLREHRERLNAWRRDNGDAPPLVHEDVDALVVARIVSDWTGVPMGRLLKDELANLLSLEELLGRRVVGQEAALTALANSLRAAKTGLRAVDAPLGVFMLIGPSGVGKTETALALADLLFGGENALITINMSEYQEAHTVSQLKGSPPGYVGYGQGGILTEAVRQRPYSVVLLDEVEKAHRDVLNLFYQVFDRGFMRDGEGLEIDFRNTVIIMTSNLGHEEIMALDQSMESPPVEEHSDAAPLEPAKESTAIVEQPQKVVEAESQPDIPSEGAAADAPMSLFLEAAMPTLNAHFPHALLARFQTIVYRPLKLPAMEKIVALKLGKIAAGLAARNGAELRFNEALVKIMARSCLLPDTGARNIDHLLNRQIMPALSMAILQWQMERGLHPSAIELSYSDDDGINVDLR